MRKLLSCFLILLVICLCVSLLLTFLCTAIGVAVISPEGTNLNIFWPVFKVVFLITFILFMAVFLGVCVFYFAAKKEQRKEKTAIMNVFSLKKNTYTEVILNLIDLPHNREFLLKIIRSLNDTGEESFDTFSTTFMGKRISLPLNENTATTQTLIKVLEDFGCKCYVHLDKKENIDEQT